MKGLIINYPDLWFTIVGFVNEYDVEFMVYKIVAQKDEIFQWQREDWRFHPDPVDSLIEAEIYFEGRVKWDGCSDWRMGGYHFCSKEQAMRLGELMWIMYDLTKEHCPNWVDFCEE